MIDWQNHDGVNISMLNDHVRNQFYNRILRDNVLDQDCIDIGFGTGLLSMLALQHGAKSITAVESDIERYQLGLDIIKLCSVESKIKLFNTRYSHDMPLYVDHPVIFSETVNGNLWQEGLWNSLPRTPGQSWLPGCLFLEIYAVPVPHSFAAGLCHAAPPADQLFFDPGVDLPDDFVFVLNDYLNTRPNIHGSLDAGLHCISSDHKTPWGFKPWFRNLLPAQASLASYKIQINQCTISVKDSKGSRCNSIDFGHKHLELMLDCVSSHETPMVLIPRCGMEHGSDRLYLDLGHWGPMKDPIVVYGLDCVRIEHDLTSGQLIYEIA